MSDFVIDATDPKPDAPQLVNIAERRERLLQERANQGFFEIERRDYSKCGHQHGVTLDMRSRKVHCRLCDETVDPFEALLTYAHSERRLKDTKEFIVAHEKKEAEKRALRKHVKRVNGFVSIMGTGRWSRTIRAVKATLECGHVVTFYGKRHPRKASCKACLRAEELKAKGVTTIKTGEAPVQL